MEGRGFTVSGEYRFGFNGKEKDGEITVEGDSYAFEARIYISRLGKFLSVDPRMIEYPWQTPYAYFKNCPSSVLDIKGMGGSFQENDIEYQSSSKDENSYKPPKRNKDWFNNPPLSLRIKMNKYRKRSNIIRQANPINSNQNIQQYENFIAQRMLQGYGDIRWMWWKESKNEEMTGQTRYIFVGGLVIPNNTQNIAIPINLQVQGGGVGSGAWNLGNNLGNISMTILNPDPVNAATFSLTFNSLINVTTLFNNQNIPPNGVLNTNFTATLRNATLFANWTVMGVGLNFTFTNQITLRTFPVIYPQIDTGDNKKRVNHSNFLLRKLRNGYSLFR